MLELWHRLWVTVTYGLMATSVYGLLLLVAYFVAPVYAWCLHKLLTKNCD